MPSPPGISPSLQPYTPGPCPTDIPPVQTHVKRQAVAVMVASSLDPISDEPSAARALSLQSGLPLPESSAVFRSIPASSWKAPAPAPEASAAFVPTPAASEAWIKPSPSVDLVPASSATAHKEKRHESSVIEAPSRVSLVPTFAASWEPLQPSLVVSSLASLPATPSPLASTYEKRQEPAASSGVPFHNPGPVAPEPTVSHNPQPQSSVVGLKPSVDLDLYQRS